MRPTRHHPIRGAGPAIVAGHPLAPAGGLQSLTGGGHAVDAGIAATEAGVRVLGVDPRRDASGAVRP